MGTFTYIYELIPVLLAEYAVIFYVFHRINKQAHCWDDEARLSERNKSISGMKESEIEAGAGLVDPLLAPQGFQDGSVEEQSEWHIAVFDDAWYAKYNFSDTYSCVYGDNWNWLLLTMRFLFMFYFVVVGTAWHFEVFPKGWNFFTNWNLTIIALYYTLAFICSVYGSLYRSGHGAAPYDWVCDEDVRRVGRSSSDFFTLHRLSVVVHILFEVLGATALVISTVNFLLLNPELVFWNMTAHLFTSCSFLVEMSLVRMPVYLLHIPYMMCWLAVFTTFTWIIVAIHIRYWPYSFMPAGHLTCLLWYSGLIIGVFIFYYLWRSMSMLKFHLVYGRSGAEQGSFSFHHSDSDRADDHHPAGATSPSNVSSRSTFVTHSGSHRGSRVEAYEAVSSGFDGNTSLSNI